MKFKEEYLLYIKNTIAKLKIRDLFIMFLNYLPNEMVEVVGLTMIFSFLVGTILILLFTSDQANTKNLYLKKAKLILNNLFFYKVPLFLIKFTRRWRT